jgi:hypothetical protein
MQMRLTNFNRSDPILLFSTGACRLNLSLFPFIDGTRLAQLDSEARPPTTTTLHSTMPSIAAQSAAARTAANTGLMVKLPRGHNQRMLSLLKQTSSFAVASNFLRSFDDSHNSIGKDQVWVVPGMGSLLIFSLNFEDLLFQLCPARGLFDRFFPILNRLLHHSSPHACIDQISTNVLGLWSLAR